MTVLQEGNELLGGEVLGDTRQETKRKQSREKSNVKRASTIDKVVQEGKFILLAQFASMAKLF